MHDDPVPGWLTGAQAAWSGHHAALADRLARPAAARLTEEQEALAFGIARRLIVTLAEGLPLRAVPDDLWARWEAEGLPAAGALAPQLLARVEEYRWRRMVGSPPADAAVPLFGPAEPPAAIIRIEGEAAPDDPGKPPPINSDPAYLALRIADGARRDALGMPLLPPAELPLALRRALLLDLAALDLALAGEDGERARQLAQAIDAQTAADHAVTIDHAARGYHRQMAAQGLVSAAAGEAMARRDWLVVLALLAADHDIGFSAMAAALLAADDRAVLAATARLGVSPTDAGILLDALAEVPARPVAQLLPRGTDDQTADTATAVAARAQALRGNRP